MSWPPVRCTARMNRRFYVCGSDQWAADSMEGAVRTGRGAAREALSRG